MDKIKILKILIGCVFIVCFLLLFVCNFYDKDNKDLGGNYTYNSEHKHILGKIDIPPTVLSYAYDDHFIIVKQKPTEFDNVIYDKMEYVYPLGRDVVYYWLILKREQIVLGPMDYDDFLNLKGKYKIPDKLMQTIN